jgi:hypothetical protein
MGLLRHRPKDAARHAHRPRLRRTAAAGLALATAATAAPLLLTAAPASAVSGKAMWVGAYATGGTTELGSVESGLGKRFDVDHSYITFNSQSILLNVGNDKAAGRAPFVNMALNCGCRSGKNGSAVAHNYWKSVVTHKYDGWLQTQANAIKGWGGPFYVTWQHEPEQTYGWEGTPADYKAALTYIVNFVRNTAPNAIFVTSFLPTSFRGTSPKVNQFWPGSIPGLIAGSTGYNWACSAHTGNQAGCGKGWKSFADVFGPVNSWANAHSVNWWVTETGSAEDPSVPGRKAQWINGLQTTADSWPRLTGVMFFFGSRSHDLFLPGTSDSSLNAFKFLMNEWAG